MGDSRGGFVMGREVATAPVLDMRTGPEPGFLEGVYASARARDTQSMRNAQVATAEQDAIRDVAARLIALGVEPAALRRENWAEGAVDRLRGTWSVERVLAEAGRRRAADPKAFGALETDVAKFRARIAEPIDARYRDVLGTAERATTAQGIVGGLWSGAAEPENVGTMALTAGGSTIAQTIVRNMVLQARVEAVSAVPRAIEMTARGEEVTVGSMAADAALAIGGTALFEGGARAIELGMSRVTASLKRRWAAMPEAVRQRWAKPEDVTEADLPDLAEAIIGRDAMSEDEAAAVSVLRREREVSEGSPYVADGAGAKAHAEGLQAALTRILSDAPPVARPAPSPVSRGTLRSGTSLQSGPATLHAAIERNETGGGSEAARQRLRSSAGAVGVMQVMPATGPEAARLAGLPWDARRFREDADYNRALGKAYYDKQLADFGAADKAAAAYNAGPGRLRAAMRKAAAAGDADGWLDYMPAETRDYVSKFRDRTGAGASGGEVAAGADRFAEQFEALNRELADLERENAALDGGGDIIADLIARDGDDVAVSPRLPDLPAIDEPAAQPTLKPELTRHVPPPAKALPVRTRPSDVIEFLADRGGIRDDEGHDLRHGRGFHRVFVPRAGPLLRPRGMDIDAAGELLHEAGFFPDRPTQAEVLEMLDAAVNQDRKFYALGDTETMAERDADLARAEAEGELDELAMDLSLDMASERELIEEVAAQVAAGMDRWEALEQAVYRRYDEGVGRIEAETGDPFDDWIPGFDDPPPGYHGEADASRGEVGPAERGDGAGSGSAGRASGADRVAEVADPELTAAAAAEFADPQGPAAKAQAESLEHDAQMDAFGGATPADVRASLERRGEGRMRAGVAQKPPGSDGGLFDVQGRDLEFRFGEDDAATTADMLARLDEEEAAIDLVEGCLPPAKPTDGGDI